MTEKINFYKNRDKIEQTWVSVADLILSHRIDGIPESELPASFRLSEPLIQAMDAMHPRMNAFSYMMFVLQLRVGTLTELDEVGRLLITDSSRKKILVQNVNGGTVKRTLTGQRLSQKGHPDMIGHMHSHPIDSFPTAPDLHGILLGWTSFEIIPTPRRIHMMVRTKLTPQFSSVDVLTGYLRAMGSSKRKTVGDRYGELFDHLRAGGVDLEAMGGYDPDLWELDDDDLSELHIARFEGPRSGKFMKRKV